MKIYHPKSFFIMLLSGFVLVAFPLLLALLSAEYFMGKLAEQSTRTVYRTTGSAKNSQILLELLRAQERKVLILDTLEAPEMLKDVEKLHLQIQETLDVLDPIMVDNNQIERTRQLRLLENQLFFALQANLSDSKERRKIIKEYKELNDIANEINEVSHKFMISETENLQKAVSRARKTILWQASILVFFSFSLITVFALLIVRPIRQIDQSIVRLGKGDFTTIIKISGPKDLEFIGEKLDWLRSRLAELEHDKIKFVAHVSHELKTPLSALREGAGLLEEEIVGPLNDQQKEVIDIVNKNSIKLQKLIENILSYNMAQARQAPLRKTKFNLADLLKEVVEGHKPLVLKKEIHLDWANELISLTADRQQIRTIVDNLLSNSLKYTPRHGSIEIKTKKQKQDVIIEIVDSGSGIAAWDADKIFSPFYQGKSPDSAPVKGSGLGLAIVKEYVVNHGGTVELVADKKKGAHFIIILPQEKLS
jgi:two-component system sensor histidine kinase GlrK